METPFYIAQARQTLQEIRALFESQPAFRPVLLIYPRMREGQDPPVHILPLVDQPQEQWPTYIRHKIAELGANHWAVASEVSMRYRMLGDLAGERVTRVEEWLIYLLSYQGGMLAWGAPVKSERKLGEVQDLTSDVRVQKMMAHLSEANGVEYN